MSLREQFELYMLLQNHPDLFAIMRALGSLETKRKRALSELEQQLAVAFDTVIDGGADDETMAWALEMLAVVNPRVARAYPGKAIASRAWGAGSRTTGRPRSFSATMHRDNSELVHRSISLTNGRYSSRSGRMGNSV